MDKTPGQTVVRTNRHMHIWHTHCWMHEPQILSAVLSLAPLSRTFYFFLPDSCAWAHKHHENPILWFTAYSHKVKLVNRTAFPVDTSSPRDMKGLDNQHTAEPIVLPQTPQSGPLLGIMAGTPFGLEPLWRCTLSSSRGSKSGGENRSD